jgi:hypothetical protein
MRRAECNEKLLKLGYSYDIVRLEFYRNISEKVGKRAEVPLVKPNGKIL